MSLVHNERTKITATYLNTMAGAFFTAGVIAPLAAAVFGVAATGTVSPLTLGIGVTIFFGASVGLHLAARYILRGLRP